MGTQGAPAGYLEDFSAIGNGATNTVFPTIGFHQPSLYASSIQLRAGGDFRFYVQGAASYASILVIKFPFKS